MASKKNIGIGVAALAVGAGAAAVAAKNRKKAESATVKKEKVLRAHNVLKDGMISNPASPTA